LSSQLVPIQWNSDSQRELVRNAACRALPHTCNSMAAIDGNVIPAAVANSSVRNGARLRRRRLVGARYHARGPAVVVALGGEESRVGCFWLPIFLERDLTVVLPEKIEESLVVALLHVEEARDDLVVTPGFLQSFADHVSDIRPGDLALHIQRIHDTPERLTFF